MTARDIVMGAAGAASTKTYVEDVFSPYLYTGNGSTQTITTGLNLSGKGGMLWIKYRGAFSTSHLIQDTARGSTNSLVTDSAGAQVAISDGVTGFTSTGFTLGADSVGYGFNGNGAKHVAYTFVKSPKFFDVVSYSGNGATSRAINHSLGTTPGMVIVKSSSLNSGDWKVWHTSTTNSGILNSTNAFATSNTSVGQPRYQGYISAADSTTFTVAAGSGSAVQQVNASGQSYIAYVFAHDATTDGLIQCGSYTGNGSATGPSVNLGWEPQYILIKSSSANATNWQMFDNMRGVATGYVDASFTPNNQNAETIATNYLSFTSTGFQITGTSADVNTNAATYVYMAIRRGPMKTPTDGTKVFQPVGRTGTATYVTVNTTITPDLVIHKARSVATDHYWVDRLRDNYYLTSGTAAETSGSTYFPVQMFGNQTGYDLGATSNVNLSGQTYIDWVFKRAPGFFDIVCYTGTGAALSVTHNLGVAPELVIIKQRNTASTTGWLVWNSGIANTEKLYLNLTNAKATDTTSWNSTSPTSTAFTVGTNVDCNTSANTYVAYLFASCPGVSKVGTYTGNGSSQTINCGFTAGARFVLIKRTDSTGDWYVWDTARGIVTANDPHLSLNSILAEVTTDDTLDPDNTGFIVNQVTATNVNVNTATYIYLAIA